MEFSFRRVNALFVKELRDFSRNPNVLVMCIFPIMFALLYGKMMANQIPKSIALALSLIASLTMIGCLVAAMLIAEEKEKNTLRTLMLTPLSPIEFLAGKSLVTLFICMFINILIFFMINPPTINLALYLLISLISSITIVILGALVGILSRNQMETGIIGLPIYLALLILPMLSSLSPLLKNIATFCFTYHTLNAIYKISQGQGLLSIKYNLLVILVWLIASLLLFVFTCKKVKLDK